MICNYGSTNKFETTVGMLNMAPTKISGQYKIVIDRELKLWLDDYTGRRVTVDSSISFLEQVANFLQVETFLSDTKYLRYGGFQKEAIKSWHIPFYFNKREYPKYFVVSRVPNDNYSANDIDNLYVYGSLLKVVDLEHIGLWKIFDEIHNNRSFNYPLYFNHEEATVKLFGMGIKEGYVKEYTLNLSDAYANQTYIDVINNRILNSFEDQKMFFPRFINIEMEFDLDVQVEQDFNNFYGFLSFYEEYNKDLLPKKYQKHFVNNEEVITEGEKHNGYFLRIRDDKFVYNRKEQVSDNFTGPDYKSLLEKYLFDIADGTVNEIQEQQPQVRFELSILNVGDIIRIKTNENIYPNLEYQIQYKDVKTYSNLYELSVYLCKKLTLLSKRDFEFSCKYTGSKVQFTVICNFEDSEKYYIELPNNAKILDRYSSDDANYKYFRGITQNDVWLCGQPNLCDNNEYVYIDNILYYIQERFKFNGYAIIRLIDNETWEQIKNGYQEGIEISPVNIKVLTNANIKETRFEKCIWLKPINFLKYYTTVDSNIQGNFVEYICSLIYEFTEWNEEQQKFVVKNSVDSDGGETDVKATYFISAIEKYTGVSWDELIATGYDEFDELPGKKFPIINKEKIHRLTNELYQYVDYNNEKKELININKIDSPTVNESIVKNMLFNSIGMTGYMTPNILNVDRQFWYQNGCLDVDKSRADSLRYTWFLLGGKRPSYISADDWRYMTITESDGKIKYRPKITSRLNRITDTLCETIFLGVKYYLPIQYANYEFAVYLEYNNPEFLDEPEYFAEVYPEENLILISINKFIDFTDLVRGGNKDELPVIDLSFFTNIKTSLNQSSDYYGKVNTITGNGNKILLLEPFYNDSNSNVYYNYKLHKNWIIDAKTNTDINGNYIDFADVRFCLRADARYDLRNHFVEFIRNEENKDEINPNILYITGEVEYNGKKFTYYSMKLEFIDVEQVNSTYLWFKDLKVTFFDTKEIFLRRLKKGIDTYEKWNKPEELEEILKIRQDSSTIIEYIDVESNSIYSDVYKIATIVTGNFEDKFKLLLPAIVEGDTLQSKPISLLNDWYRVSKYTTETPDGKPIFEVTTEYLNAGKSDKFKENYIESLINDLTNDNATYISEIHLFDRNQIWKIVQESLYNNVRFKEFTEEEMWQELDKFSIEKFLESQNRSIPIINKNINTHEFADKYIIVSAFNIDKNYVIWNINNNASIVRINRHQTAYYPFLPIQTDILKFQILNYQKNNTLWNLYDTKFGGSIQVVDSDIDDSAQYVEKPISATTLWEEIQGNIISTLYCKKDSIQITIPYNKVEGNKINYLELLKSTLNYEDCIVSNDNTNYIESLNKNVKSYIIETYANMLLSKHYTFDTLTNQDNMRLPYTIDSQQQYTINVGNAANLSSCYLGTETLVINLIRK